MKKVSSAYKQAMDKSIRNRSYMMISIGVISNEAQTTAKVISETSRYSDNKSLFKSATVENYYSFLDENVYKANEKMLFPPENEGVIQLANNVGFVSNELLGGITIEFDKPYNLKGITIDFGECYPTEFTIAINSGVAQTYQNSAELYSNEVNYNNAKTITITPIHFVNGDNKRLRINSMLMGVGIVFQNEDIETANFSDSASFISEELPQLDFNVVCFDRYKKFNVDDENSFINYLEAGQEVTTAIGIKLDNGSIEWVDMPRTYLSTWSSNTNKVGFSTVDRFALLTGKYENGNVIHSRSLYDEAVAVLTDAGLTEDDYSISDYLKTITITNPMPVVSYAECLQLIANAGRCLLKQDVKGRIVLTPNFENIIHPNEIVVTSNSAAEWSNPQDIIKGSEVCYSDFASNWIKADGSNLFLPEEDNDGAYKNTGYVSEQLSNSQGFFVENMLADVLMTLEDKQEYSTSKWRVNKDHSITLYCGEDNKQHRGVDDRGHLCYDIFVDLPAGTYAFSFLPRSEFEYTHCKNLSVQLKKCETSPTWGYVERAIWSWIATSGLRSLNEFTVEESGTYKLEYLFDVVSANNPFIYNFETGYFRITPAIYRKEGNGAWDTFYRGTFFKRKPYLDVKLPSELPFFDLRLSFLTAIKDMNLNCYHGDSLVKTISLVQQEDQKDFEINIASDNEMIDRLSIVVNETFYPYQRVVLSHFGIGILPEYTLKKFNMLLDPIGTVNPKTQATYVKVFNYVDDNGTPKQVDDNVYYTFTVNSTGENVTFENPLISDSTHAETIARWIANYYGNNITYEVDYRGELSLESADYIYLDSEILNNLLVEIESLSLEYKGSLSGKLSLRRAGNVVFNYD